MTQTILRRPNQPLFIDQDVTVTVRQVRGKAVVLEVDSPADYFIRPAETWAQWQPVRRSVNGWSTYRLV